MLVSKSTFLKYIWPADLAGRMARLAIGLLLIGCVLNLELSPDPARNGIASRLAAGKRPMVKHYVATYNWYMAAANAVLLTGLLVTVPLWVRPTAKHRPAESEGEVPAPVPGRTRPDALTWGMLFLATGSLLFLTLPRMDHSLWGDEEYTFRRNVFGEHERKDPKDFMSTPVLERVSWLDTVYGYKKPNNHIFQTILSRLCFEAWMAARSTADKCRPQVAEWTLRLPSLLAAVATLPALVALGCALGQARVGGMAAVLLSVHPWFQRYASEARGYAIVMFFTVVLCLLLLLALRQGKWKWWLLYGLSQFLLMWCYPGAAFVPLGLNLFAIAYFFWQRRSQAEWFWSNGSRWLVVNLLSAMCFLQLMLPCLPMLNDYLRDDPSVPEAMGLSWFKDLAGHMLGGMDGWQHWGESEAYESWEELARTSPVIFVLGVAGTAGVMLLGLYAQFRRPGRGLERWLILVWAILPFAITIIHGQVTQHYYYIWYLIFALPGYALLWAMGIDKIAGALGKLPRCPAVAGSALALALGLAFMLPAVAGRLMSQRKFAVEPLAESVRLMRGPNACFPYDAGDTLTAGLIMSSRTYDPNYIRVTTAAELQNVAAYAQEHDKKLFIAFGAAGLAEVRLPDVVKELRHTGKYQLVTILPGTWPFVSREVYQLKSSAPPSGIPN